MLCHHTDQIDSSVHGITLIKVIHTINNQGPSYQFCIVRAYRETAVRSIHQKRATRVAVLLKSLATVLLQRVVIRCGLVLTLSALRLPVFKCCTILLVRACNKDKIHISTPIPSHFSTMVMHQLTPSPYHPIWEIHAHYAQSSTCSGAECRAYSTLIVDAGRLSSHTLPPQAFSTCSRLSICADMQCCWSAAPPITLP
jgi:hypothetical protein